MTLQQKIMMGLHTLVLVAHHAMFQMLPAEPERTDLPKCVQGELQIASCLFQLGSITLVATEPLRAWLYAMPLTPVSVWNWGGRPVPKPNRGTPTSPAKPRPWTRRRAGPLDHADNETEADGAATVAQRLWAH
ncbi:hypothetical protein [Puniceibacterium sp. IMCC21224]|uniref:hypothetical protein n=1 Tax=Puniceibacterium sp. IMCC21224 TaxID=1618204 RepID=UPI00064DCC91|nr:hypothetical protein [Puniceibacterium sp. IMCC21224]KMK66004.1 hypothetical protein IMCC21224_11849 [Puniceibacterium sp. IMCC21224]